MNVTVKIPPAIANMAPQLSEFFDAMVHKLNVNSHKDAIREDDVDGLLDKLSEEIREFKDQRLKDSKDPNNLEELADIGNFSFLLYAFLRSRGIRDLREQFILKFFRVDIGTGRIYCQETRSGSPLKIGDEIVGTVRNGRHHIRVQHSITGAIVSCPRAHIVWWVAEGKWPHGEIRNKNGDKSDDRFDNLEHIDTNGNSKEFPFVSQYNPRGKENTVNYGRWVYQRRYKFQLIRVGYWDTPEEAAVEGLAAWKVKTRENNDV